MLPHGVMFHHFHDDFHPAGQGSMSGEQLRQLLEWFGPGRILRADEWYERATSGTLRSQDVGLTFDDILRCQFDVALPVLRQLGLTAFWFVYSSVLQGRIEPLEIYRHFRMTRFESVEDFYESFFDTLAESSVGAMVDRQLSGFDPRGYLADFPFYTDADRRFRYTRDELLGPDRYFELMDQMIASAGLDVGATARSLWMDDAAIKTLYAQGHVIGLHSHTHPTRLNRLSEREQREEYGQNHDHLSGLLGTPPLTMSHPCNSYDDQTLRVLAGLGIRLGFRANVSQPNFGPLEHPREDHANLLRRMAA